MKYGHTGSGVAKTQKYMLGWKKGKHPGISQIFSGNGNAVNGKALSAIAYKSGNYKKYIIILFSHERKF